MSANPYARQHETHRRDAWDEGYAAAREQAATDDERLADESLAQGWPERARVMRQSAIRHRAMEPTP